MNTFAPNYSVTVKSLTLIISCTSTWLLLGQHAFGTRKVTWLWNTARAWPPTPLTANATTNSLNAAKKWWQATHSKARLQGESTTWEDKNIWFIWYHAGSATYSMLEKRRTPSTSGWTDTILTEEQRKQKKQLQPTFANWTTLWRTCKWGGSRRPTRVAQSGGERESFWIFTLRTLSSYELNLGIFSSANSLCKVAKY